MEKSTTTNRLINSTSPYLLQHAYNPVDWYPWEKEAFEKARKEDKPIILSIGYSSCHWCHVMEHESFENNAVAELMNNHFVSIKLDREERPDVDQVYMDALQAMGMNGGWPLNVFLTPDLKPFYGGTYFPTDQWQRVLTQINNVYEKKKDEVMASADDLAAALSTSEIHKYKLGISEKDLTPEILDDAFDKMASRFDRVRGGIDKAPKFPMPSVWLFLLKYAKMTENHAALDYLKLTLNRIASGGIFDQAGGGFARYSTDKEWLAPHFEKMLYDNGQLLSLYAEAYNATGDDYYKEIISRTVDWLEREILDKNGGFYSALDADSEGEEGKFYVFTSEEIDQVLSPELVLLTKDFFNISAEGNWEHGNNILHSEKTPEEYAKANNIELNDLQEQLKEIRQTLLKYRETRIRPGLDDKVLTSWNALTISGLADAYRATNDIRYLNMALATVNFLRQHLFSNGKLLRSYNKNHAHIDAYLEDYALYIQSLIKMFEVSFDDSYLSEAKKLSDHVISNFFDEEEGMFFFTSSGSEALIARKKEIFDNVIPSSNSVMATNLYLLSLYFDKKPYHEMAEKMVRRVSEQLSNEPVYLSNWAILYLLMSRPTAEIVIVGDQHEEFRQELEKHYLPNKVIMGGKTEGILPLMENRPTKGGKTTMYVCYNKTCKLPVNSIEQALKQLN